MIRLSLPWPPSANRYWRHPTTGKLAGRHLISADGRAYRTAVMAAKLEQHGSGVLFDDSTRIGVSIQAFVPDRRKRDLDNLCKATLDALAKSAVFADDSQIDHLEISRCSKVTGGSLIVDIRALTNGV